MDVKQSRLRWSDQRNEIAAALVKAQMEMEAPIRDQDNPYHGSKYADLSGFLGAGLPPLNKNGIAFLQFPYFDGVNVGVTGCLIHTSGQWVEGELELRPDKTSPQACGSAITYARRYQAGGMMGLAPEDDDGNAASTAPANNGSGQPKNQSRDSAQGTNARGNTQPANQGERQQSNAPKSSTQGGASNATAAGQKNKDNKGKSAAKPVPIFNLESNTHLDAMAAKCRDLGIQDEDVISQIAVKLNGRPTTDLTVIAKEFGYEKTTNTTKARNEGSGQGTQKFSDAKAG